MRKFLSFIGGLCAFVTVAVYALLNINAAFGSFLPANIVTIFAYVKEFGALIVVAITGLEFVWVKKVGLLLVVIYLALVAIVVIFMFFPGVASSMIGIVGA